MPAKCWMAPEMPAATYSCGATILPVCPTCQSLPAPTDLLADRNFLVSVT